MRLTLLSHFIGRGGSTGFFLQLRDFFQSCGHEVSLVVGNDAPDRQAEEYAVVPSVGGQAWRERMREYVRVIEQTRPDVVYTTCGREEFEVLRFLRFPRALHCGCIEQHEYSDLPLWYRQLEPYTELRTTHTPDMLDKVKGQPRHRIQLAYAPHRLPEIFFHAPNVDGAKPGSGPIEVCFLSRVENFQKRAHWLPEIMQRCRAGGANLRWHIYGTGPNEPELRRGVQQANLTRDVSFHGWQEPEYLAPRLGGHDLFFLCSRWEGLPAALVEAMLCGVACVVPNFPAGMTYMLKDGGGWIYDAASPQRAAEALLQAVADRSRLQQQKLQAQKVARAQYAREVVDRRLHEVEAVVKQLRFNGNVCDLNSARPMQLVTWPVLLKRRWNSLKKRVGQAPFLSLRHEPQT